MQVNVSNTAVGGRIAKIHALVDVQKPLDPVPMQINFSIMKDADLMTGEAIGDKPMIAARGYDSYRFQSGTRERGSDLSAPPPFAKPPPSRILALAMNTAATGAF
jgi:hypothetical protein